MSEAALRRVLVAVVVLGLAYLGVRLFGPGAGDGAAADDPVTAHVLGPARAEAVTAAEIRRSDLVLDLTHGTEGWRVNRFEADTTTVGDFLRTLREATVSELVSRNPANHRDVGVAADSSWTLRIVAGGETTPLLHVGKEGPYDRSAYVRVEGDDRVYLLRGALRSLMSGALIQWRSKRVTTADTAKVAEIAVRRPSGGYRLRRGGDGWRMNGTRASGEAVGRILEELHGMRAYAFAGDTSVMGEPTRFVEALDARGDTLAWIRAAPAASGSNWTVRSSRGQGAVFRVDARRVERISPPGDSVRSAGEGG